MRCVSSTPRGRPSATTGMPTTRRSARRCPRRWRSRSSRSTKPCACSAGRCSRCRASRPTTPSARWRAIAAASGHKVLISTGDKDLAQLVTPDVTLINTMAKPPEVLDVEGVMAKFGVPPQRIVDYLTLVGDTRGQRARGRQGRPEDGREVAGRTRLARRRHRRGRRHQGRDRRQPAQGAGLAAHRPAAGDRAHRLRPVGAGAGLAGAGRAGAARGGPRQGCSTSSCATAFAAWRKELEERGAGAATAPTRPRRAAERPARPQRWRCRANTRPCSTGSASSIGCSTSRAAELVALDTETDSLDGMRAQIVGISFATQPGIAAYVPLRHDYPGAPEQLPRDEVLARLAPWLQDASRGQGRARTSSTTCMSLPTTASPCRATATTPCCRATCSRRTSRTAWKAWPSATWAARA